MESAQEAEGSAENDKLTAAKQEMKAEGANMAVKKEQYVKVKEEVASSSLKVEAKQEERKLVQTPKVTKCRSKARIQKKKDTLRLKKKLTKKRKQQQKQQARIEDWLERAKREKEAEEWPPSPAHSRPTSSEEDSSEVMEDAAEVMDVLSEDIP